MESRRSGRPLLVLPVSRHCIDETTQIQRHSTSRDQVSQTKTAVSDVTVNMERCTGGRTAKTVETLAAYSDALG